MWQVQLTDENIFVGTVEGFPSADTIIGQLKKKKINTAWLMPFMSVAGDHAQNDMAGKGKDSWKSLFENAGINCSIVLKGTAEYDEFVQIWVDHLKKAVSDL
jgi:sirohydrochlorin cobaltochelatase